MVAEPKPEPFITEELAELTEGLEGVIYEPRSLPQELREMPVWMKVALNDRGQWKKPCVEFRGKLSSRNWQLSSYHLALDEVLKQQPAGKAGFYARDRLCVIDLDDVIDPVTRQLKEPKILVLQNTLKASVYLSSSGIGVHIPFRLQKGVKIDPPGKNLSFRDTEGKSGQFLGGKFKSFVAFTGVAVPRYDYGWLIEITQDEWNYIREFLWSVETIDHHTEPLEPTPLALPVSTPQERSPREPEPNETPFGIKWKSNFRQAAINKLAGWSDRPNDGDESPSGEVFSWLMFYWKAVEEPDWDEAFDLSVRAEGFYLSKQIPGNRETAKGRDWHEYNVNKSLRFRTDKSSDERMVFRAKGEKYGKTQQEDRMLEAVNYVQAKKMEKRDCVFFLEVIGQSEGRNSFRLPDGVIVERTSLSESSVTRAKNSFRDNYGDVLKIDGNQYRIIE